MDRHGKSGGAEGWRRKIKVEKTGGIRHDTGASQEARGHPGPADPRQTGRTGTSQAAPVSLAKAIGACDHLVFERIRRYYQVIVCACLGGRERRHIGAASGQRPVGCVISAIQTEVWDPPPNPTAVVVKIRMETITVAGDHSVRSEVG